MPNLTLNIEGGLTIQYRPWKVNLFGWHIALGKTKRETYPLAFSYPIVAANTTLWHEGPVELALESGMLVVKFSDSPIWSHDVHANIPVRFDKRGVKGEFSVKISDEPLTRGWSGETIPIVEPPKGG